MLTFLPLPLKIKEVANAKGIIQRARQSYLIIIHPLTTSMDDSHQLILQKRSIFLIRLPGIALYQCQIYAMFLQCLFHLRGVPAEK